MQQKLPATDPRLFQVVFQLIFLSYGILFLEWEAAWMHYALTIGGCLFFNYVFESVRRQKILPLRGRNGFISWGLSVLISAMSICLLLKTNHWTTSLLTTFLTVASKYIFRFKGKHIFNPSAFGIIATLVLTGDAWLSPGQWGSGVVIFFAVATLGTIVVTRVQKLDVSLVFLLAFVGLLFWRQVLVLGWPSDFFLHSISTGSLLLFTFFMISDPRTAPDHPFARIIWAVIIAATSFYLSAFRWQYNTAIWMLVLAAPLVPVLDHLFKAERFSWNKPAGNSFHIQLKHFIMKPAFKKLTAIILLLSFGSHEAFAFCGFYVSKADGTLKNKTSQVIMVRDGNRNVITMFNDYQGNLKDFAMVVPVPVVLKKSDIKVVDQSIFNLLNEYSKPRLVEYYDQNPCNNYRVESFKNGTPQAALQDVAVTGYGQRKSTVKIEARYLVGEYDILILSSKESSDLRTWLNENGYKIPPGADEVLEPYIKSNLKFFVAKVNEKEQKRLGGQFLRPIQISFSSPKFMLPIRLGMANADGDQDLLIYAFTKKGRVECTNYRTVALPTGKNIPLFVKNNFANFYSNLFQHQWKKEGRSVAMLEYAWDVSPANYVKCDPCVATAPSTQDLVQAGVWWVTRNWEDYSDVMGEDDYSDKVYFTRLHVRYNRASFPQDLTFQVTPNKENYQARYVITHPASGDFNCEAGKKYISQLRIRRKAELETLTSLTGKSYEDWDVVMSDDRRLPREAWYLTASLHAGQEHNNNKMVFGAISLLGIASLVGFGRRRSV